MIEEDAAGTGEFDAASAADQQLRANLIFQVPDLTAERWLSGMQPPLGGDREAAFLRDGDKIAEMTQLHIFFHACEVWRQAYKVFFRHAMSA